MDNLRMYPHPGKFEGELLIAQVVYAAILDGGADEDATILGESYSLIRGGIDDPNNGMVDEELTRKEHRFLRTMAGAILHESDQGFVSVEWFDREETDALEKKWDLILDQQEAEIEAEAEEDDGVFGGAF